MQAIKWTKRTTIIVAALAIVAVAVSGAIVANYVIPTNTVRITSSPGVTAYEADGVTPITSIQWGDVQQGTSQSHQVILRNTGGTFTIYILENPVRRTDGQVFSVSSLTSQGLPSGVTLTWDLQTTTAYANSCTVNGVQYVGCLALGQGTSTSTITMTLSASATATPTSTSFNFVIEFDAFNSPTG